MIGVAGIAPGGLARANKGERRSSATALRKAARRVDLTPAG
jgi:hypothetical protein